jgi:hypothetical protein
MLGRMGVVARYRAAPTTLTISAGGTYSGVFESAAEATPAITVSTTAAVTITDSIIRHAGRGINATVTATNLTVRNCKFTRLPPAAPTTNNNGRAVILSAPATLTIENCSLVGGNGIWVGTGPATVSNLKIRYNYAENIGFYTPTNCCIQFFQTDQITMPGGEVAWNHVRNVHNQSDVEDVINFFKSGGSSGALLDVHHNLIDGAWAQTADGAGYTGGGIVGGDTSTGVPGGSWTDIHDNWAVSTTNYGVSIAGGSNNSLRNNYVVNDAYDEASILHGPDFGTGVVAWDGYAVGGMTNIVVTGNTSGWMRRTSAGGIARSDYWLPAATTQSGNVSISGTPSAATEQAARDAWDAARSSAGVTVGPNW